jgi:hypothetical protein
MDTATPSTCCTLDVCTANCVWPFPSSSCRVAALLAAKHAIEHEGRQAVAIVAGDTVASAPLQDFLARADGSCRASSSSSSSSSTIAQVPSPVIPNLYDRVARWHMQQYGTTREQLVSQGWLLHVNCLSWGVVCVLQRLWVDGGSVAGLAIKKQCTQAGPHMCCLLYREGLHIAWGYMLCTVSAETSKIPSTIRLWRLQPLAWVLQQGVSYRTQAATDVWGGIVTSGYFDYATDVVPSNMVLAFVLPHRLAGHVCKPDDPSSQPPPRCHAQAATPSAGDSAAYP